MSGSNSSKSTTPLPIRKIVVLGCILAANNTSIWMIFSFLPFMVHRFYPLLDTTELGYEAGLLGSAFSLGSLLGSIMWGVIADRIGRRPALLYGLIGTIISSICFGFSWTYPMAIASRFLWGFLNGNIGVSKTYMAEILDDSNSAKGMAVFGVLGGVGRTIGPMLGGFLSSPAESYAIFRGTIFETFPFALPSLAVAFLCSVFTVVAYFELTETLKMRSTNHVNRSKKSHKSSIQMITSSILSSTNRASPSSPVYSVLSNDSAHPDELDPESDVAIDDERSNNCSSSSSSNSRDNRRLLFSESDVDDSPIERGSLLTAPSSSSRVDSASINCRPHHPSINAVTSERTVSPIRIGYRGKMFESSSPASLKRRVSFSGVVMVKHIDSDTIGFGVMNKIDPQEQPVQIQVQIHTQGQQGQVELLSPSDNQKHKNSFPDYSDSPVNSTDMSEDPLLSPSPYTVSVSSSGFTSYNPLARRDDDVVDESLQDSSQRFTSIDSRSSSSSNHINNNNRSSFESSPMSIPSPLRYSNGAHESDDPSRKNRGVLNYLGGLKYLLSKQEVMISTCLYGIVGFTTISINEVIPLWVVNTPADGGFNYNARIIAIAATISGPITIVSQLFLYPYMVAKLGLVKTYWYGSLLYSITAISFPLLSLMNNPSIFHPLIPWTLFVFGVSLLGVSAMWAFISIFVIINNSCYSHERARVNGIGQSFAALGRLLGPYFGATVFAWSENNGLPWPMNFHFVWYILGFITLGSMFLVFFLPRSIYRRKREPKEPRYAVSMMHEDLEDELGDDKVDDEDEDEDEDFDGDVFHEKSYSDQQRTSLATRRK